MKLRTVKILGVICFSFALTGGGGLAWARAASIQPLPPNLPSPHSARALPLALRPALYSALAKGSGAAYRFDTQGCAVLLRQKLKACFNAGGAHFTGDGAPLALHFVAYGREPAGQADHAGLTPVDTVRPIVRGNRASYRHGDLSEWWRVLPVGFEQGFTIAKPPVGHGELTLALAMNRHNTGASDKGTVTWGKLHYGELVVTDANGRILPSALETQGDRLLITVDDTHAVYPLTVDPMVWLEQKVTASDGTALDTFGFSVALSGSTAIIATPFATVNGNAYQGAAYVFTDSNGVWTQGRKLTADDGAQNDYFGYSVALDGATALVGAPHAGADGNAQQGAVYVFKRSGTNWTQVAKLTASDGAAYDNLGWSVALSGATALAGTPYATVNGNTYQGAVYVFTETDGNWTQAQKLTASDGAASDEFAATLSLDGTTALVGAPYESIGANGYQGAVYVFSNDNGTWTQTQKLIASDGSWGDEFGSAISVSNSTAIIGAEVATVNGHYGQGAAYVFTKSGGAWTQTQKLIASDGAAYDSFGWAVVCKGTTALIGAVGAAIGGHAGQGAVYVFDDSSGTWTQARKLTASDGAAGDGLGNSAALSGSTALVGAEYASVNGNDSQGAAYFYGRSDLGLALSAPQTVGQGQNYTSQAIATNSSSVASPAVSATITVPAAASFVSATASQGSCSEASGVVTCDFGPIPGNAGMATASVTLKATGSAGTTIENTASIAKATPPLTASAPTGITSPAACPAGYTEFSGHLDAGGTFASAPIEVMEAGEKYVDLTSPASFTFFAIVSTVYGQHTYIYPHVKHGHRWGAAGSYRVGVQAGPDAGGDYTLCVNLNPAQ